MCLSGGLGCSQAVTAARLLRHLSGQMGQWSWGCSWESGHNDDSKRAAVKAALGSPLPVYMYISIAPCYHLYPFLSGIVSVRPSLAVTFALGTSLFAVEICPQTATIAISSLSIVCSLKISGLEKARTSSEGVGANLTKL